jgi:rubrerythrin
MPDAPTYLGLLNAIALAEARAHCYFEAWSAVTPSPAVREVLKTVSWREGEHGMAFAKRINELGYELREKDDPASARAMEIASSTRPDLEKFEALRLTRISEDILTYFDNVFADHTIDVQTGALLGRYIAEEHDTARLLRSCYDALLAAESGQGTHAGGVDDRINSLTAQVEMLCGAVDDLRQLVHAQSAPASNGAADPEPKRSRR